MFKKIFCGIVLFLVSPLVAHVHHIKSIDQLNELLAQNASVVIKFSAQWCPPCKKLAPVFDKLSTQVAVTCAEVDVDACKNIATLYSIRSMPTLIFIQNGNILSKSAGFMNYYDLREKVRSVLGR